MVFDPQCWHADCLCVGMLVCRVGLWPASLEFFV
jgi:hypothetical protein